MLILTRGDVERLLPMPDCIVLMAEALSARARGDAVQPLRTILRVPGGAGLLGSMPAYVGSPPALGVKVIAVYTGNQASGAASHQGAVLSIDPATGALDALLEGGAVTAIRTAAVSGVATDRLALRDADDVAILGAGVQGATHLDAIHAVRPIRRLRIWNRTPARAHALAERARRRHGIAAEVAATPEGAARGAAIICTVTHAREPILKGEWLAPGAHVNAVGSSTPDARELDTQAVRRAALFVDAKESALNEAGDILTPLAEGAFGPDHIRAELGDVLIGRHPGRQSAGEITLFKSLGLGIEDVSAARFVVAEARRLGEGQEVSLF